MKRYLLSLFCIAMSVILLSGCGSSSNNQSTEGTDWEPTMYETVNNLDGVTMVVKEGTVSATGLTVILSNTSDKQCIYSEDFMLEKEIEGKWYQVPIALGSAFGFNDIGYDLASLDVGEWTVDWEWLYGSVHAGEYRIVKDILDFRQAGDFETYHLAAEFTID